MPVSDRWMLADNSKGPFEVVAEGTKVSSSILNEEKYQTIWAQVFPEDPYIPADSADVAR